MNNIDRVILLNMNWVKADLFVKLTGFTIKEVKKSLSKYSSGLILCTAPDDTLMVNFPLYHAWAQNQRTRKQIMANNGINIVQSNVYSELSGFSKREISHRKNSGQWDSKIIFTAPDGNELINVKEVEKWVTKTRR